MAETIADHSLDVRLVRCGVTDVAGKRLVPKPFFAIATALTSTDYSPRYGRLALSLSEAGTIATMQFQATHCAICGAGAPATKLYPANFDVDDITPARFSARRLPDRVHYRMVRCARCGLVRSDPVLDEATLAHLYAQSTFDYEAETANLKATMGGTSPSSGASATIRIRCSKSGVAMGSSQQALAQGYTTVRGVEPSKSRSETRRLE